MYTISLLLLALFSIYIGVFSFWRWDASWLRNLDTVPAKFLFVLVFALFLLSLIHISNPGLQAPGASF